MSNKPIEKIKTVKIIVFALLYLLSGFILSMVPYWGGERDGCGLLLWIFTVIPFLFFLIATLIVAILALRNIWRYSFSKVILIGSTITFWLNWVLLLSYVTIIPFLFFLIAALIIAILELKNIFECSFSKAILVGSTITFLLIWLVSLCTNNYVPEYFIRTASFLGWVLYFIMPAIYYGLAKLFFRD